MMQPRFDIEIDRPAAQRAWEQVQKIAAQQGDKAWEARAQGGFGFYDKLRENHTQEAMT